MQRCAEPQKLTMMHVGHAMPICGGIEHLGGAQFLTSGAPNWCLAVTAELSHLPSFKHH